MTRDQAIEAAKRFGPGWIAMDSDGSWWWFPDRPNYVKDGWICYTASCEFLGYSIGWRESLEEVGE